MPETARSRHPGCSACGPAHGAPPRMARPSPVRRPGIQPQVGEDLLDRCPLQDRRDDLQLASVAARAAPQVDVEHALEQPRPADVLRPSLRGLRLAAEHVQCGGALVGRGGRSRPRRGGCCIQPTHHFRAVVAARAADATVADAGRPGPAPKTPATVWRLAMNREAPIDDRRSPIAARAIRESLPGSAHVAPTDDARRPQPPQVQKAECPRCPTMASSARWRAAPKCSENCGRRWWFASSCAAAAASTTSGAACRACRRPC